MEAAAGVPSSEVVVVVLAVVLPVNSPPPSPDVACSPAPESPDPVVATGVLAREKKELWLAWLVCPMMPVAVVFAVFRPEKLLPVFEPRLLKAKPELEPVPTPVVVDFPNGMLIVVVVAPNGLMAESPSVLLARDFTPLVAVPNPEAEVPVPKVNPAEPPPPNRLPVPVAAAILIQSII